MAFYGRENEQEALNYIIQKDDFGSGLIFGRRRLGKTELLKHCFSNSNKPFIIYQCNQENETSNILDLTKVIRETLGVKNLAFDTFVDAIEYLFEYAMNNELLCQLMNIHILEKLLMG